MIKNHSQTYVKWARTIFYTEDEIRHIRPNFCHPQSEKIYALMKCVCPNENTPETLPEIENIQSVCAVCQRGADASYRSHVSLPHPDVVFNLFVSLGLMKFIKNSVLNVLDRNKLFNVTKILSGESTMQAWEAFMLTWVMTYIVYPTL